MKASTFIKGVLVVASLAAAALCVPAGLVAGVFLGASAASGAAAVGLGALGAVAGVAAGVVAGGLLSFPAKNMLSARAGKVFSKISNRRHPVTEETAAAKIASLSLKDAFSAPSEEAPAAVAAVTHSPAFKPE